MPNQPEQTQSVVPGNDNGIPSNGCHAPIPATNHQDAPSNGDKGPGYQGAGCQATAAGDMTSHMTSSLNATSPASKELEMQIGSTRSIWENSSSSVAKQPSVGGENGNPGGSGGGKFCFGRISGYFWLIIMC